MAKIQRSRKQRCKLRSLPRKIVKTDASGAITLDDHGHATNAKVLDLSITKSVLMILCASLLMIVIFGSMARNYKKSPIPTGAGKLFEPLVIFIRDEIAIPNIGRNITNIFLIY